MNRMKGFAINLKHREDRKEHILSEIRKLPFVDLEIVEGIVDETKTCFQSQRKCIELARNQNLPYVLILEDDAVFTDNAAEMIEKCFNDIKEFRTWNMLFLGANVQVECHKVSENLIWLNGAYAAHAYIVNSNFYDTILDLPHDREMDVHYYNLMKTNFIYLCNPMVAYQLPSYSDLQDGYRNYNEAMNRNFKKYVL